jgi:predicted phage baseplate assembly protein
MPLPAPNLDDRRFQQLVDDAKRLVQQRCPEWTDHNVSDPGVTLIETFAYMVDQMLYRLNRVPDRNYIKFLELIGVKLLPPTAARALITFWLTAAQEQTVSVPLGTEASTQRTDAEEAVSFTVTETLDIVACSLERLASVVDGSTVRDHTSILNNLNERFYCFDTVPKPNDFFLIGLSNGVSSCAVLIRIDCTIEGVGVDPRDPPIVWEAWDGDSWERCEVERDTTGGLNREGEIVVHVPKGHVASLIANQQAGWLRCRVIEARDDQPTYGASPLIRGASACTIGGTAEAVNAQIVEDEIIGLSEGVAGQRFTLKHTPVVPSEAPMVLEVAAGSGWQTWELVPDFAGSGPDDRHFGLDEVGGDVLLGPAVRQADGTLRQYGAVPPKGAPMRLSAYRTGGGRRGNVARRAVTVLETSLPLIQSIENRQAAAGGVDAESLEEAKLRGPILLRTRDRAVTAEDYEILAHEAAPEIARIKCVPVGDAGDAGNVRVLVVPSVTEEGRFEFAQLVPAEESQEAIARHLASRKVIGTRVVVEPPTYQAVTVVARLRAKPHTSPTRLQSSALHGLYRYFHPLVGGPDGDGWPFGRPVHVGEVYGVLQKVEGVEFVEDARLFGADPTTGERGDAVQRIEIGSTTLVFSFEHQVLVEGA